MGVERVQNKEQWQAISMFDGDHGDRLRRAWLWGGNLFVFFCRARNWWWELCEVDIYIWNLEFRDRREDFFSE